MTETYQKPLEQEIAENIQFQRNVKIFGAIAAMIGLLALTYATNGGIIGVILFFGIVGTLYFLPTICARSNGHHNVEAILILNLLLGWTLVGWVVAMVWANMKSPLAPQTTTTAGPPKKTVDPRWQDLRA